LSNFEKNCSRQVLHYGPVLFLAPMSHQVEHFALFLDLGKQHDELIFLAEIGNHCVSTYQENNYEFNRHVLLV